MNRCACIKPLAQASPRRGFGRRAGGCQQRKEQRFSTTRIPSAWLAEPACKNLSALLRRLTELTFHRQQTQRTLPDWLRVEYAIEKPSNKLLAPTELDSNTWVSEVKRIRGKRLPLTFAPSAL